MSIAHNGKFDGLFGEDGSREWGRVRAAEPLMAGMFGANAITLKQADRKSPVMPPVELAHPDED